MDYSTDTNSISLPLVHSGENQVPSVRPSHLHFPQVGDFFKIANVLAPSDRGQGSQRPLIVLVCDIRRLDGLHGVEVRLLLLVYVDRRVEHGLDQLVALLDARQKHAEVRVVLANPQHLVQAFLGAGEVQEN